MVTQDRTAYPDVLPAMIRTWKEKMHQTTPVVTQEVATSTEAYHELWDETLEQE
jgi:hypothetical protein